MIQEHPKSSDLRLEDVRVGATIRTIRELRGMTQEQLAQASMLSRPYIALLEVGRRKASTKAVARIAAALQVPQISLVAINEDQQAAA